MERCYLQPYYLFLLSNFIEPLVPKLASFWTYFSCLSIMFSHKSPPDYLFHFVPGYVSQMDTRINSLHMCLKSCIHWIPLSTLSTTLPFNPSADTQASTIPESLLCLLSLFTPATGNPQCTSQSSTLPQLLLLTIHTCPNLY